METNTSGQVTLAILGVQLAQLSEQLKDHDVRQREEVGACRRNCAIDHDAITRHDGMLVALRDDVAKAKDTVDGLTRETRVLSSLATIVAIAAGMLGLTKS